MIEDLSLNILYSGGGFDSGSPSDPKIDGSFLASKGIVFASYGYRLSLWGYPHALEIAEAGETQNFGLLDTRAVVEWVRDNIEAFGGDPNKITLGGESVGAEMTNQYMSAFSKDPIIRAAVMQSADTNQPMWGLNNQITAIANNFSCPTGQGELDCLRKVSAVDLQTVLLATGNQFQPVTDNITIFKDYVKQTRQKTVASIPLLIGTNKDEGTLIVQGEPTATDERAYITSNNLNLPWASPTDLLKIYPVPSAEFPAALNATAGMWRDAHMLCLASNLGRERTNVLKQPVWRYRFDLLANNLNSQGTSIGVFHGEDIRFVMGTTSLIVQSAPFIPVTPFEQAVSDLMVTAWTNFVKGRFKLFKNFFHICSTTSLLQLF
ncbi:hypothetical protein M422DRAFT_55139 [Sphaerobolus stellatus SS14]|uniref:Carboxylesterase type B domain-containing protein n=1 Tax=Sphaerobolus stellatus (strain SS14) TaxID=990650 RepID=A0A0C9TDF4_SPHS4|nr:hypothetical protein M422DRAFT_55139 [Sphaerobolus stellatus SS14]